MWSLGIGTISVIIIIFFTEYDDVVNPYEGENEGIYSRDNICFLTSIDSVPGICRWAGKLSRIDSERLNVAISYVEGRVNLFTGSKASFAIRQVHIYCSTNFMTVVEQIQSITE